MGNFNLTPPHRAIYLTENTVALWQFLIFILGVMPQIIIDNIPLEVPEGISILEAARSADIVIPHFCWHPALGRAGACRVCAVKLLEGPVKGIQMSCMLPVQDGMVVSTADPEAVALRARVIEWLMVNHPHDCPVCDEGGECQLQDYTIAGGHGIRRYDGKKRTHVNQYLGEFIEHEMNRCIQCYRCVRFYQEYAGGTDFGVLGRAAAVYFGRQSDGSLQSPFSGNLVDICPTGVFTDRTARYRARYWDYDMAPSICPHCSLGCNTVPMARYRELLKVTARRNDTVNGWFICDRGRFSNREVHAPDRPRRPLVDGQTVSVAAAIETLAERVITFMAAGSSGALAVVGSQRMSHEGNVMAARLAKLLGECVLCYFVDGAVSAGAVAVPGLLTPETAASQQDVRDADLVVILGCDLPAEAPMMALAVRQAWRNGARVYRAAAAVSVQDTGSGPQDVLPFGYETVVSLDMIPFCEARRPVIISGTGAAARTALRSAAPPHARLAFILEGPDTHGCALLARVHGAVPLDDALAGGAVTGIISFEADLPADLPDAIAVIGAADWRPGAAVSRAGVFLPATAWVEQCGTFINNEGRTQRFEKIMAPGLPIQGLDPAGHPPRVHRHTAPGSDPLPAEHLIRLLMEQLSLRMAR